jgi:hypothetical protein
MAEVGWGMLKRANRFEDKPLRASRTLTWTLAGGAQPRYAAPMSPERAQAFRRSKHTVSVQTLGGCCGERLLRKGFSS